ncbi:unnamed protein product [Sphenostylis stenocarpa]|uniref:Uncharacterized protein n=1 Tax=Sphenostylis stenocarpa TaxID=92480 RepID=A0AA86RWP4_9FABA|nr:unnamed protein product [Sphenostylis stenocarpa]
MDSGMIVFSIINRSNSRNGRKESSELELLPALTSTVVVLFSSLLLRWSLIAGRLPGRTSNDVKNYWSTYTRRKLQSHNKDNNVKQHDTESTLKPHEVIKPLPRALSKTCPKLQEKSINSFKVGVSEEGAISSSGSGNWWETLLDEKEENIAVNKKTCFLGGEDGVFELWDEELGSVASDFLTEGLKRCRKSCRLRWLNYLKPNIKRGDFSEDEVDLIIRLHKLLGNRWSLIAGRLPGRTSNDVKNYWSTYTRRKLQSHNKDNNVKQHDTESTLKPHEVIKPLPQALSKTCPKLLQEKSINSFKDGVGEGATSSSGSGNWWETLLDEKEGNIAVNNKTCFFGGENGVFMLRDEELGSIASDFFTEGETWSTFFLT